MKDSSHIFSHRSPQPCFLIDALSLASSLGPVRALLRLVMGGVGGRESWLVAPHGPITATFLCAGTPEIWSLSCGQLSGKLSHALLRV